MKGKHELGKFELLLERIGDNGLYQQLLLWLFFAPLNFLIAWVALGPILLTSVPDHWCNVPGRPQDIDQDTWINLTVPREADGSLSQCLQYNMSQFDLSDLLSSSVVERQNISCQNNSFFYDTTDFDSTLATRNNWVCNESSTVASWLSVGVAGNVVGTLFLNPLADILGRRWMFLVSAMIHALGSIARVFVSSHVLIMLTQFVASTAFPPVLEIALILVYELVDSAWRSRVTSIAYSFWAMGTCALAMVGYFARTERTLSLIISLPFLMYLPAIWIIPESSRWLLARSKVEAAKKFLLTIAKVNKQTPPEDMDERLQEIAGEDEPHRGALQLLQTPTLRRRTILLTLCYVLNNLFFYGIAYNTANMSGNVFMNFFLLGITEIPSNIAGWWASLNLGRRWTQTLALFCGGVTVSFVLFLGESAPPVASIALLTISKFFISISFLVVYLQMGELYPTTHCGTGIGVASVVASTVGMSAPYIAYSAKHWWGLPYVIMLVLALLGCIISSFVPETLGTPVPQTLTDAENFLLGVPYWSFRGRKFWRCGRDKRTDTRPVQGHTNPIPPVD